MARDCYKIFKSVYAQGIADGITAATAAVAAQAAMADCLSQQADRITAIQPIVSVPGGTIPDPGPSDAPNDLAGRASNLGRRNK